MSIVSELRNSFIPSKQSLSSSMKLAPLMTAKLEPRFIFRKESRRLCHRDRNYCVNQKVSKPDPIQPKQNERKILKYVTGFLGVCVLTVFGAVEYWKRTYRRKGIEPVISRRYGWRNVHYHYRGYVLPGFVANNLDGILSFQVREDDVWIIGFPKSGTTWLQEAVSLIGNGADLERVQTTIEHRVPNLEWFTPGLKFIEEMSSPRYIKTHLPFSVLPYDYYKKKPKTIYISRNPKDLAVSYYFYGNTFLSGKLHLPISFDAFCQLFSNDEVLMGPWWKHVKEGWEKREDHNVLYITYEDMKSDLPGIVRKIAAFLGKELSDKDVEKVVSHCNIDSMRNNNFVNKEWYRNTGLAGNDGRYLRKGIVGDWKNHMSKENEAKLDEMVARKLKPSGVSFKYTLAESNK